MALRPSGRGLQRVAERTRGPTPPAVPATEAEAAAVRQEVRPALRRRRRPRPDAGGAEGLPGPLKGGSGPGRDGKLDLTGFFHVFNKLLKRPFDVGKGTKSATDNKIHTSWQVGHLKFPV